MDTRLETAQSSATKGGWVTYREPSLSTARRQSGDRQKTGHEGVGLFDGALGDREVVRRASPQCGPDPHAPPYDRCLRDALGRHPRHCVAQTSSATLAFCFAWEIEAAVRHPAAPQ